MDCVHSDEEERSITERHPPAEAAGGEATLRTAGGADARAEAYAREARALGFRPTPEARPRSGYATANGLRLHYLEWGETGRRRLLLLHGGGQQASAWDYFAMLVCDRFHVVALDQRGHGESDWSPAVDYTRHAQVEDIRQFVAQRELAPLVAIGFSMGGRNALYAAAMYPEAVEALVITDIGLHVDQGGGAQMAPLFEEPAELDAPEGFLERAGRAYPHWTAERLRKGVFGNLRQLPNGKWSWKYDLRAIQELRKFEREHGDEYHRMIRSIRRPTLIVRGAESNIMLPDDATALQAMIAGSRRVEVPGAKHRVMRENPVGYAVAIRDFLKSEGLW
jgi:pimeloyl-ACP methyl ester carboxylesterase